MCERFETHEFLGAHQRWSDWPRLKPICHARSRRPIPTPALCNGLSRRQTSNHAAGAPWGKGCPSWPCKVCVRLSELGYTPWRLMWFAFAGRLRNSPSKGVMWQYSSGSLAACGQVVGLEIHPYQFARIAHGSA